MCFCEVHTVEEGNVCLCEVHAVEGDPYLYEVYTVADPYP